MANISIFAHPAPWAKATTRTPQTIAHRGYKAKYAENSMKAMCAAVEAGADALETDVHLTADGVVVLSHVSALGLSTMVVKKK